MNATKQFVDDEKAHSKVSKEPPAGCLKTLPFLSLGYTVYRARRSLSVLQPRIYSRALSS